MGKYHRTKDGTAWLEITWLDLMAYSGNPCPICDECGKDLIGCDNIMLIPILNEAFCPKCGQAKLSSLHSYPEDRPIEAAGTVLDAAFWHKRNGCPYLPKRGNRLTQQTLQKVFVCIVAHLHNKYKEGQRIG